MQYGIMYIKLLYLHRKDYSYPNRTGMAHPVFHVTLKSFFRILLISGLLSVLFLSSGCSGKDVCIYVFTQDYDAPVNQEWLATQEDGPETPVAKTYTKGSWLATRGIPDKDTLLVTSHEEKYDVEMSVLALLTPEQYAATLNRDTDSPDYIKNLSGYLESHNVIMLSDGSTPAGSAKSTGTDFLYLLIPALLLLLIGYLCSDRDAGSLILPVAGLAVMLSQIVVFFLIVGGAGVKINAIEIFILVAVIPAIAIMAVNLYAGYQMSAAVLRHYNVSINLKSILICIGTGIVAYFVFFFATKTIMGIQELTDETIWIIPAGYVFGALAATVAFCIILHRRNPSSVKAIFLLLPIFILTAVFGAILLLILFTIWLALLVHNRLIKPGGGMLGDPIPKCRNCVHYNSSVCSLTGMQSDPENKCSNFSS